MAMTDEQLDSLAAAYQLKGLAALGVTFEAWLVSLGHLAPDRPSTAKCPVRVSPRPNSANNGGQGPAKVVLLTNPIQPLRLDYRGD